MNQREVDCAMTMDGSTQLRCPSCNGIDFAEEGRFYVCHRLADKQLHALIDSLNPPWLTDPVPQREARPGSSRAWPFFSAMVVPRAAAASSRHPTQPRRRKGETRVRKR